MSVKPIPEGCHTVTPYLVVRGVPKLIEFLKQAFEAQEVERMTLPDGTVTHAEVRIGDSVVMMGEARGDTPPMPAGLYLYVSDTDAAYQRALKAGASSTMAPEDMYYGDRNAGVKDPFGNQWWIATHQEDLSPAELQRRTEERANQRKA